MSTPQPEDLDEWAEWNRAHLQSGEGPDPEVERALAALWEAFGDEVPWNDAQPEDEKGGSDDCGTAAA